MYVDDPKDLLASIPAERFEAVGLSHRVSASIKTPEYAEPGGDSGTDQLPSSQNAIASNGLIHSSTKERVSPQASDRRFAIQALPSFVDTDALAPIECLATCQTPAELAQHCLKYTHPTFRERAKEGATIVVAGDAFGCGSSRGIAVTALLGCRIRAVIAPSFSFISGRNAANLGLLCVTMTNDRGLYNAVADSEDTEVDINMETMNITVHRERDKKIFPFELSNTEKQLVARGGITNA